MQKFHLPSPHCTARPAAPASRPTFFRRSARAARWLGAFAALALACSCSKPPPEPPPTPTPEPTPTPTPKPTPTPVPTPTPPPTPTPVVHHYAPEGTFYVTEDMTAHLKGGLMGVSAGTEVKMLKDNGDTAQVTDGQTPFDIKKTQLTNDLDIAAAIMKKTRAIEAAADVVRAQQDALAAKQAQDQIDYLKSHPLSQPTPTPTPHR